MYRSSPLLLVTAARAHHLPVTFCASLVATWVLIRWADVSVEVPLGTRVLPLALCLPVVLSLFHGYPLLDWWHSFSAALPRMNVYYRLALIAVADALTVACAGSSIMSMQATAIMTNTLLLIAAVQLFVMGFGDLYWVPAVVLGFALLTLQLSNSDAARRYETATAGKPALIAAAIIAAGAGLLLAAVGPRHVRVTGDEA
jgi:hypothetical protein